jgi:hypothetical protein
MLWNGQEKPPAANDDGDNNTRLIKSRSGHTVRFNDDDSAPELEVRLTDGKRLLLDQNGISLDDGNGNVLTFTSASGAIRIEAGQRLSLKAADITIEASSGLSVSSSGTLTLKGTVVQIN